MGMKDILAKKFDLETAEGRERCGYLTSCSTPKKRCEHAADYRSATVTRCREHGDHHDYTERWNGISWEPHPEARQAGLPPDFQTRRAPDSQEDEGFRESDYFEHERRERA